MEHQKLRFHPPKCSALVGPEVNAKLASAARVALGPDDVVAAASGRSIVFVCARTGQCLAVVRTDPDVVWSAQAPVWRQEIVWAPRFFVGAWRHVPSRAYQRVAPALHRRSKMRTRTPSSHSRGRPRGEKTTGVVAAAGPAVRGGEACWRRAGETAKCASGTPLREVCSSTRIPLRCVLLVGSGGRLAGCIWTVVVLPDASSSRCRGQKPQVIAIALMLPC